MANIDINKLIVVDIETLINCFTLYAKDYATGAEKQFVIFDHKEYEGQALKLYQFLKTCVNHGYTFVTFNGLFFDMPVLHYFYDWCGDRQDPLHEFETGFIIDRIYEKAQEIIQTPENEQFKNIIPEDKLFLPTIDLFKQKHYDRKKASLKWVEFTMRFPNIEEMPIPHDELITLEQVEQVVSYNRNDVLATYEFFKLIKFETELRLKLSEEYDENLINAAEPRLAREIFGTILAPKMNIPYSDLKKLRTFRKEVAFEDIIFPYIKFHTPELQKVLTHLRKTVINCDQNSKQEFEYEFNYHGLDVYLGLGGIHSCIKPGVYTPKEDQICKDSDAKSFYPNIAIQNGLKPEHLGDTFLTVYGDIYEQRKVIPKKDPKNYVYKIILNSAFGLSSEINSYFFDKKLTYGITVNGQLLLLMFCEALYASVPDVQIIQKNTDGISYIYDKKYQDRVEKIWTWWQGMTKIELEHADYSKMIIIDVNNYIAVDTKGSVKKRKGRLAYSMKPEDGELDYHKNPSHLIVPKAIEQYFVNDIPIEETIRKCDDIYDFCGGIKKTKDFKLNLYRNLGGAEIVEEQQKVTRYFISSNKYESGLLVKDFTDGRKVSALANTQIQSLNYVPQGREAASNYKINYDFYIRKARDIVEQIHPKVTQTALF